MNKIKLPGLAVAMLILAQGAMAGAPVSQTPFNKVVKRQGTPSLVGFGHQANINQANTKSTSVFPSLAGSSISVSGLIYAPDQKAPVFFKTNRVISSAELSTLALAQAAAIQVLAANTSLLTVKDPSSEFTLKSSETDNLGMTHVKMTQMYMGVKVWGRELIVHFSPSGTMVNGRWSSTPSLAPLLSPVSRSAAIATAQNDAFAGKAAIEFNAATKKLLSYTGPSAELVVYARDVHSTADRWAYRVTLRTGFINMYEYFIDAVTGAIITKDNISCSTGPSTATLTDLNNATQTVNTYQNSGGTYNMIDVTRPMYNAARSQMPDNPVGALWTLDANFASASNIQVNQEVSSNNTTWPNSATAASASVNAATAYNYYQSVHSRNSIDGQGGTIISVINVNDDQGQPMDNAFWNGQLMAYGNGNTYFKPLAGGLDVAGHEMTHGVIQSTANLEYKDQSGALNESMADVFGCLISGSNYTIGGTVTLTSFIPTGFLRSLSDPHNGTTAGNPGWQPAVMSEYVSTTDDNGGVHTNSGITNHAFYFFATAVTKAHAEQVYYRALTKYFTANSQFLDARIAIVQAAADLYGSGSADVQAAKSAFDQVGIYDGTNTQPLDTAAVNGGDWIIYQSTDPNNMHSLYEIPCNTTLTAADLHPLNTRPAYNRVSITDDGSIAYFVDTNHNVYSLSTDYNNPVETALTNTGDWDFVAVSRDGQNLALISDFQDTAIWIYNINSSTFAKFHLFDPTFSQDSTTTNGPVYATTADWSANNENVIYDEKNLINNTLSSTDISYYDIGVINVWNASNGSFATGAINKLVNSLPAGISIGNPVYSKNHANIVAFDQVNDSTGTYNALGADINTGAIGTIFSGNTIANVPSYSGADDQITFTYQDQAGVSNIGTKAVASDLINGSGNSAGLIDSAQWSVWFRKGTRNTQCQGIAVNITANGPTDYPLTSVVLDAGSGFSSYQWNTGDITQTITATQAGTYEVVVTKNGCTLTQAITIGYPTGISTVAENVVKIYPVPAADKINIDLTAATGYSIAEITDMTGRVIASQFISGTNEQVDIASFALGMYIIRLKNDTGTMTYTSRIIKD